jgi:hypothetical protein
VDVADLVRAARGVSALRAPALHFAAIGALLFALTSARERAVTLEVVREPIAVSAAQVEALVASYERRAGRPASTDEVRALVEAEVEEEVLFREALTHGLDRNDKGVAWRLVEKMTFLSDHDAPGDASLLEQATGLGLAEGDPIVRRIVVEKMRIALRSVARETPSDAELQAWVERHRERFEQPGRVVLSQAVLTRDRRGDAFAADAAALSAALRGSAAPAEEGVQHSDPTAFPTRAWALSDDEVAGRFGAAFAQAMAALPAGRWSAPIESPYGLHVVLVHERSRGGLPPLDAVRSRALLGYVAERRAEALREGVARLRAAWDVRVEWPARFATTLVGSASL